MNTLEKLRLEGLIPVVVMEDAAGAADTAKAICDGGLHVMEITMRTEAGIEAIRQAKKACPDMLVGAGTVLSLDKAKEAVDAGAEFIVSPGFNDKVVEWCLQNSIPITPGAVTPTEIDHALSFGLTVLKFFPANVYGGLNGIKALNGPFRMVSFIPTGGVSESNLAEFADKPFVHAIGGGWLCSDKALKAKDYASITKTVANSISILLGFELAHVGINCDTGTQAESVAKEMESAFGFAYKPGASSDFAGVGVEALKTRGLGAMGHIAMRTNNIDRAMYHLGKRGYAADEATRKEKGGKTIAIYLKKDFGGFAVHLLQK